MQALNLLGDVRQPLSVLCLGAHADDIEIGAGATLLTWLAGARPIEVFWCVFSAEGERAAEAHNSATDWLSGAAGAIVEVHSFPDSHFPSSIREIKATIEAVRRRTNPQVIFTHRRDDAHQDHRAIAELTWNTFRDHLIFEYEIPKWDGDLGQPNCYSPVEAAILDRKVQLLERHFRSQQDKSWFDGETFRGLARLRGLECRAHYAEAFEMRKCIMSL